MGDERGRRNPGPRYGAERNVVHTKGESARNVAQLIEMLRKEDQGAEVIMLDDTVQSPVQSLNRCFWLDDPDNGWTRNKREDYGDKASQAVTAVELYWGDLD